MRFDLADFRKRFLLLFLLLFAAFVSNGQTLTLYSFPSPHPYKWRSPHSLLTSTIRNYYSKTKYQPRRMLGHMVIELKKDTVVFLTGMVSDEISGMKNSLLKEKIGLGVLYKLVKGHMEETSEVQTEIRMRAEISKVAFISFKISDSGYNYLRAFVDSFKLRGYDSLYNGFNMPRAGKGCGCTAFGMSFLELINALLPEYSDKWAVHINVPEKLIGDKLAKKKVSIRRLFFSFRWARTGTPYRKLELYEPYLIYNWVNDIWKKEHDKSDTKYEFIQIGGAKGLLVDCSACLPISTMFIR